MVPELSRRPLSMERSPRASPAAASSRNTGKKHYPGGSTAPCWTEKPRSATHIHTPAALVYFANQGAIALHVTSSRRRRPTTPTRSSSISDPPEGGFDLVRRAARIIHDCSTASACRRSSRPPARRGCTWSARSTVARATTRSRRFGARASEVLCQRHADLFTTEFYKKDRHGRLYLDMMRNGYGATAVAPYSLRGRAGAPVAAPIDWSEVDDAALAADGFRLRDVRARLDARGDPWRALRERLGNLGDAAALVFG